MEYSDYLALLSELCQLFDQISHVEQQKIDAVQGHALDELNEAMKREQALTLALRGCELERPVEVEEIDHLLLLGEHIPV